jgi:enoyl-CoA hydratase/carnithine racemase
LSVRLTKESVLAGLGRPIEEAMAADQERLRLLLASEDFREGPRAFVEKRKPQWKGR